MKNSCQGIIYRATNLVNGKVYIGLTSHSLEHRQNLHYNSAFLYQSHYYFHRALRKYGKYNFKWEIIDTASDKITLMQKEVYWIAVHDSFNDSSKGYNMTSGGQTGELSFEAKNRKSESLKGRVSPMKGKVSEKKGKTLEEILGSKEKADKQKQRVSSLLKGKKKSKEHKEKIKQTRTKRCADGSIKINVSKIKETKRQDFLKSLGITHETFINDYRSGLAYSEIADKYGCCYHTVRSYIKKHFPNEFDKYTKSRKIRINKDTQKEAFKKSSITKFNKYKKPLYDNIVSILEDRKNKMTWENIAKKYNTNVKTLRCVVKSFI